MFCRPCFTLPRKTQESTLIISSKGPPLACFITSTPMRTRASLWLTCVRGKGKWRAKCWAFIHAFLCVSHTFCFFSVQLWVRLQLPLVGQPESQLGGGEESGHDGTAARGPQIRNSPGCPQGKPPVPLIRRSEGAPDVKSHVVCVRLIVDCIVGGAGEEPGEPAIHHSHSSDARRWNDLAGARGAVLRASTRWKYYLVSPGDLLHNMRYDFTWSF